MHARCHLGDAFAFTVINPSFHLKAIMGIPHFQNKVIDISFFPSLTVFVLHSLGTPTCINGKRVAICGAGGKAATAHCRAKLTELLSFMKADVLAEQVGIAVPAEAWGTDVLTFTDEQKAELKALADKLCAEHGH